MRHPQHFPTRGSQLRSCAKRPVSGLAGLGESPSHESVAETHSGLIELSYRIQFEPIDSPTPAYRCGGSTGLRNESLTCFPFNQTLAHLAPSAAGIVADRNMESVFQQIALREPGIWPYDQGFNFARPGIYIMITNPDLTNFLKGYT